MESGKKSPPRGDMATLPQNTLPFQEAVGLCVVSRSGQVGFQNPICRKICGDQTGCVCNRKVTEFCRNREARTPLDLGLKISACEEIPRNGFFDVGLINQGDQEAVIFYPVEDRLAKEERAFEKMNLTRRELAIVQLLLRRQRNVQISHALGITESTLRTHLKSIYRKVTPAGRGLLFRVRNG